MLLRGNGGRTKANFLSKVKAPSPGDPDGKPNTENMYQYETAPPAGCKRFPAASYRRS